MKIKNYLFIATLAIVSILVISCSETINDVEDSFTAANEEKSSERASAWGNGCTFSGELTESEIAALMEIREEEKLAHDVYQYFFEMYDHVIFENIAKREEVHTNAVLNLIKGYGLEDPTPTEAGVYSYLPFNELYNSLIEKGTVNLTEALKVGAFVEEYDINDLQKLLEETQNQDVILVYSNLLQGSKSHLSAFSKVLNQLGEIYVPTILYEEEYNDIITTENSNGNRNGNGNNAKYGNGSGNKSNNGSGSQYGKSNQSNSSQGKQNGNNGVSNSAVCDGTGPNS